MTAEAVEAQQRAYFLAWRRELAQMEDVEGLILTPFEKNLEVWAQLWRVLERSHAVIQVVAALCTATAHARTGAMLAAICRARLSHARPRTASSLLAGEPRLCSQRPSSSC